MSSLQKSTYRIVSSLASLAILVLIYRFVISPRIAQVDRDFLHRAYTNPLILAGLASIYVGGFVLQQMRERILAQAGPSSTPSRRRPSATLKKYREFYGPRDKYVVLYQFLSWGGVLAFGIGSMILVFGR